jgi:hypothetical protein
VNEVRVIEIRPINDGRPLRAFADVRVGDWVIYGWRIVKQDSQRAWVSVPQATWRNTEGKVRYQALLSIPGELKQRIEIAILSAWEKENSRNEKR